MNTSHDALKTIKIREKDNGSFEGRVCYNGIRKSFCAKTEREVKNKAAEWLKNADSMPVTTLRQTFDDMAQKTLDYKATKIEPSSHTKIKRTYNNLVKPMIGHKQFTDIGVKDIQDMVDFYAFGNQKNLAKSGIKKIMSFINLVYSYAALEGYVLNNPTKNVVIPRDSAFVVKTKKEWALNDAQIEAVRAGSAKLTAKGYMRYRDGMCFLLMLGYGLREGEALALTWDDIDFDKMLIHVNKTVQISEDDDKRRIYSVKDTTKTPNGVRTIPFTESLLKYFEAARAYDKYFNVPTDLNLVCHNRVGKLQRTENLDKAFRAMCVREKVVELDPLGRMPYPYILRHTFGSKLIRSGVDISVVSSLMGHANINVTYKHYIHIIEEQKALAMQRFSVFDEKPDESEEVEDEIA